MLVVNVISLGWNCYLSALNSGGGAKEEVKEKMKEVVGKGKLGQEGGELPPS